MSFIQGWLKGDFRFTPFGWKVGKIPQGLKILDPLSKIPILILIPYILMIIYQVQLITPTPSAKIILPRSAEFLPAAPPRIVQNCLNKTTSLPPPHENFGEPFLRPTSLDIPVLNRNTISIWRKLKLNRNLRTQWIQYLLMFSYISLKIFLIICFKRKNC